MKTVVPYLQIRANTAISYALTERDNYNNPYKALPNLATQAKINALAELTTYTGELRPGAKKRLTKALELLVQTVKPVNILNTVTGRQQKLELVFITLTLAEKKFIPANTAHKHLLEPLLQWMRRSYGCKLYVWKAELQKRGQLHYHITADCFIPHQELRKKWNDLQKEHGYLEDFYRRYKHHNPPGTEIKSVFDKKNLIGYLKKKIIIGYANNKKIISELNKSTQNKKTVMGKVWDCSLNLKKYGYFTMIEDSRSYFKLKQLVETGQVRQVNTDHCTIFDFKQSRAELFLNAQATKDYHEHLESVRLFIRKPAQIVRTLPEIKIDFIPQLSFFSDS